MTTLRIAEVAERTGVPATTLRYYEDIGLLDPTERTGNGYRSYSERDVERLRFINRAKQLDINLDDLRELVTAWDGDDCGAVQERMAEVVASRLALTQERLVDLVALAAQLQAAAARLASTLAHPGRCDDDCACSTASTATAPTHVDLLPRAQRQPVDVTAVTSHQARSGAPSIACTLDHRAARGRLDDWRAVLARAVTRDPIPGGSVLTFDHDPEVTAELARLAAAEHVCCTFFDFTIAVTGDGVRFEVRAPDEARQVVAAVFGTPGAAE